MCQLVEAAALVARSDRDDDPTAQAFQTAAQAKVAMDDKHTVIAAIGDQESDVEQQSVDVGKAERRFKLLNPLYFSLNEQKLICCGWYQSLCGEPQQSLLSAYLYNR